MKFVTLTEDQFGTCEDPKSGKTEKVRRFTWNNFNGITIQAISYGATVTVISVPNKFGEYGDIVLGYDDMKGYLNPKNGYFGATIGRHAGRISKAEFSIDGQKYSVSKNYDKVHHLHGGCIGFDKVNWKCFVKGNQVIMSYYSADGEEGYPGHLIAYAFMELTEKDEFKINYKAYTSKPTICNLTIHNYFNLGGHETGSDEVIRHTFFICADTILETGDSNIPTGKILPVSNTPFDFRHSARLEERLLKLKNGFDTTYCINKAGCKMVLMCKVEHPSSGRILELYSDKPALQFYTSECFESHLGKGNAKYERQGAFALEPYNHPDSMHHCEFPQCKLYPTEEYENNITFKFLYSKK